MTDTNESTNDLTATQIADIILAYQDSDRVNRMQDRLPVDPTTKENTKRVWARIPVSVEDKITSISNEPGFKSREMLLCAALGFAMTHERKFRNYCSDSAVATDKYGVDSGHPSASTSSAEDEPSTPDQSSQASTNTGQASANSGQDTDTTREDTRGSVSGRQPSTQNERMRDQDEQPFLGGPDE